MTRTFVIRRGWLWFLILSVGANHTWPPDSL